MNLGIVHIPTTWQPNASPTLILIKPSIDDRTNLSHKILANHSLPHQKKLCQTVWNTVAIFVFPQLKPPNNKMTSLFRIWSKHDTSEQTSHHYLLSPLLLPRFPGLSMISVCSTVPPNQSFLTSSHDFLLLLPALFRWFTILGGCWTRHTHSHTHGKKAFFSFEWRLSVLFRADVSTRLKRRSEETGLFPRGPMPEAGPRCAGRQTTLGPLFSFSRAYVLSRRKCVSSVCMNVCVLLAFGNMA